MDRRHLNRQADQPAERGLQIEHGHQTANNKSGAVFPSHFRISVVLRISPIAPQQKSRQAQSPNGYQHRQNPGGHVQRPVHGSRGPGRHDKSQTPERIDDADIAENDTGQPQQSGAEQQNAGGDQQCFGHGEIFPVTVFRGQKTGGRPRPSDSAWLIARRRINGRRASADSG